MEVPIRHQKIQTRKQITDVKKFKSIWRMQTASRFVMWAGECSSWYMYVEGHNQRCVDCPAFFTYVQDDPQAIAR